MKEKRYIVGLLLALFAIGLIGALLLFRQQQFYESQKSIQNEILQQQIQLEESIRKSSLVPLMANILDKVDAELARNPSRVLTDETIARIAALSYSFAPYHYKEGDSLSNKKYSPERGQLLLALANMKMDSSSFGKIKLKTSFSGAALSGANLEGFDLSGIDLKGANLNEADLRRADLRNAKLMEANLWGANMRKVNLEGANLRRSNMAWVNLRDAVVSSVVFAGSNMTSAKMNHLDFTGSDLKWVNLSGALLKEVNFLEVELTGADLTKANLSAADMKNTALSFANLDEATLRNADLNGTNLTCANLNQADLVGVDLSNAELYKVTFKEENWLKKLNEWKVKGSEEIAERYKVEKDLSGMSNHWLFPNKK